MNLNLTFPTFTIAYLNYPDILARLNEVRASGYDGDIWMAKNDDPRFRPVRPQEQYILLDKKPKPPFTTDESWFYPGNREDRIWVMIGANCGAQAWAEDQSYRRQQDIPDTNSDNYPVPVTLPAGTALVSTDLVAAVNEFLDILAHDVQTDVHERDDLSLRLHRAMGRPEPEGEDEGAAARHTPKSQL